MIETLHISTKSIPEPDTDIFKLKSGREPEMNERELMVHLNNVKESLIFFLKVR